MSSVFIPTYIFMRYLSGEEEAQAREYFFACVQLAEKATCQRSRCGSVVIQDNHLIWSGFNSPPNNLESQRRCSCAKENYHKKITDKTCCIHAEQRAIMDALQHNADKIVWSKLYFIRLDTGGDIDFAGKPYCTICSKMALDVGISEFILRHKEGIVAYPIDEYNQISFSYTE